MKIKTFIATILCSLLLTGWAKADQVLLNHWELAPANLVGGKLYVPAGTVNISFTVYFTRGGGTAYPDAHFILGSVNSSNNTHSVAAGPFVITTADFTDPNQTFGRKTFTATISASNLSNNNIVLLTDPFFQTTPNYNPSYTTQLQILYQTTTSNVQNGTVIFHNQSIYPSFVTFSTPTTTITTSQSPILSANQSVYSNSGNYKLILQGDGNLVLYRTADNYVMWTTDTNGSGANYLFFQLDGNLVLTQTTDPSTVVWASNIYADGQTQPNGYPNMYQYAAYSKYVLQDDGNLIMIISTSYTGNTAHPGTYQTLGDTGSGNNSQSQHYGRIE